MSAWRPYNNAAGERIPSVTTVLSRFKESGALMHWAWVQGRDGKDYRETRDAAADAGSCAHALIEAHIKSAPFVEQGWTDDALARGRVAFGAFQAWSAGCNLMPVASELRLVSETMQVGGTIDCVATVGNALAIVDWKTGGLYPDHLYQVAAYAMLYEEANPGAQIIGYHLCRFNRESGDFSHSYFAELEQQRQGFLLMRRLYTIDQATKKRVK